MPQACTICTHRSRPEIDRRLVSGEPNLRIATSFALTESAIRRHKSRHLSEALLKAQERKELQRSTSLLEDLRRLNDRTEAFLEATEGVLKRAQAAEDDPQILSAAKHAAIVTRELRSNLQFVGQVTGELRQDRAEEGSRTLVVLLPLMDREGGRNADTRPLSSFRLARPAELPPGAGPVVEAEWEEVGRHRRQTGPSQATYRQNLGRGASVPALRFQRSAGLSGVNGSPIARFRSWRA
jgi:hypothetical protein